MSLESIVKNIKRNFIYPLLFSTMIFSCKEQDSVTSPTPTPKPPENKPPNTFIHNPQNNAVINSSNVLVEWIGEDPDGKVVGYDVFLDNEPKTYETNLFKNFTNLNNGSHNVKVAAKDDKGAYDPTPAQVNFNVQAENIGPIDNTDQNGYAKIEIGSAIFDVYVKNQSNQPLNKIIVSGFNYQLSMYGFLGEDFSGVYASELVNYAPEILKSDFVNSNALIDMFMRAKENNRIRIQKVYNYRLNKGVLVFRDKVTLSDLSEIYKKHDALFQSISLLEFLIDITEPGTFASSAFTFALQAAKFREEIINNANNVSIIINKVASYFGQGYDADAYYFDVYQHKDLKILTHVPNEENLCTLKGKVTDSNNNLITNALITLGSDGIASDSTDSNGNYIIKKILASGYTATATATGYQNQTKFKNIVAPMPPLYTSTILDFQLSPTATEQTITLQPGPEGKDARVEIVKNSQGSCLFYCDDNFGNENYLSVVSRIQSNGIEHHYRSHLQFDLSQISSSAIIDSAKLYIYGDPSADHTSISNLNVECREVTSSWLENTITWNSQPSLGNVQDTKTINYNGKPLNASDSYWESWNVTNLVNQWKNNQKPNYGISITTSDSPELSYCVFFMTSSDHSNSSLRPKLVVYIR